MSINFDDRKNVNKILNGFDRAWLIGSFGIF